MCRDLIESHNQYGHFYSAPSPSAEVSQTLKISLWERGAKVETRGAVFVRYGAAINIEWDSDESRTDWEPR